MADVQLDYRVPDDDLKSYVTLFYYFSTSLERFEDIERADHAQLRFRLSQGGAHYHFADGVEQQAAAVHVLGPTTGAVRTCAEGPVEVVGLGLQPAGWAAMLGIDASTMHNRAFDAAAVFGDVALETEAILRTAVGSDAKITVLADFVRTLVRGRGARALSFARHIDAWLAGSVSPGLEDLVERTAMSRRQIERWCNMLYGAPPKVLARKYRALRAAVALASGAAELDDLIAQGFYDQSHLIRELKQFTGLTPRQIVTEPGLLQQLTISQRRALGGQVHPLISDT